MAAWRDVTDFCKRVAEELKATELVKPMITTSTFSLHDSMSAVEIMDPKMDQCTNLGVGKKTLPELYKISIPSEMTLSDLLPIFIKMIVSEVSFLQGYSVIESTHNCVLLWPQSWPYLESDPSLISRILLAYGQSNLKTISHLFNYITTAEIYEDEDFNPAFHTLAHCDTLTDEDSLLSRISSLIEEVKALAAFAGQDALVLLLEYRAQFHQIARDLHTHTRSVVSITTTALRNKRRLGKIESGKLLDYPDFAPVCRAMFSFQSTLQRVQSHALLAELANTYLPAPSETINSLNVASFSFSAGEAIQSFFRSELTRLKNTSPVRVIAPPSFAQATQTLLRVTEEFQDLQAIVSSWAQNRQVVLEEVAVLPWDYLFAVSCVVSQRQWHLLARSFYLACLQQSAAYHLDLSLWHSLAQRGVPNSILQREEVRHGWLSGSLFALAWDVLKALAITRAKLFAQRWPLILQSAGHVVSEAMYVDECIRSSLLLSQQQSGVNGVNGVGNASIESSSPLVFQWFTTYGAVLSTQLMDVYLQLLQELSLCAPDELDALFWYADYVHSTHLHALDKLRAQRLQCDIQRYEETRMARERRERDVKDLLRLRAQQQAQFDLQHSVVAGAGAKSTAKKHKNNHKNSNKHNNNNNNNNNNSSSSSSSMKEEKRVFDEAMARIDAQLAQLRIEEDADNNNNNNNSGSLSLSLSLPEVIPASAEDHLRRGQAQLSRGLFRASLVYKQHQQHQQCGGVGLVADVHRDWMTKRQLFARRFGAFESLVNPAPLSFADFLQTVNQQQQQQQQQPIGSIGTETTIETETTTGTVKDAERVAEEAMETTRLSDAAAVLRGALQCFQSARKHLDEARKFSTHNVLETQAQLRANQAANHSAAQSLAQQGALATVPTLLARTKGKNVATHTMDQAVALIKVSLASVLATTKILDEVVAPLEPQTTTTAIAANNNNSNNSNSNINSNKQQRRSVAANTSYHPHYPVLELVPLLPPPPAAAVPTTTTAALASK